MPVNPPPPKFNVDQAGSAKHGAKKTPIFVQNIRVSEYSTLNWGVRGLSKCNIGFEYGCFFVTYRKEIKSTLSIVWDHFAQINIEHHMVSTSHGALYRAGNTSALYQHGLCRMLCLVHRGQVVAINIEHRMVSTSHWVLYRAGNIRALYHHPFCIASAIFGRDFQQELVNRATG